MKAICPLCSKPMLAKVPHRHDDPDGRHVYYILDPDPLHVPEPRLPVHEPTEPRRSGCWPFVALLLGLILVLIAAPRSAPHPTVVVPRDLSGLHADASDPKLSGAPLTLTTVPSVRLRAETESGRGWLGDDGALPSPVPESTPALISDPPADPYQSPAPTGEISSVLTGTPSDVTWQGTLSYVDRAFGPLYLALPEPRGTVATICGPADCVTRTSTDFGPDQRLYPDRIADLSAADFGRVCGVPLSLGLCPGSVTIQRRSLPHTDTTP